MYYQRYRDSLSGRSAAARHAADDEGHAENEPNPATFYSDGPVGYTDYPRRTA
ncbi:hypothetical protein [Labedella populi]|uniref:hypothetical protein n=1 Tax=Labedella populi TaxID=2498850 RepID=UPI00140B2A03|nr:hypothetical protein [Labedella populi]